MIDSVRETVGQCPLEFRPDELIGIKLGGISGETVSLEAGISLKKSLNRRCPVDRIAIPEKNDRSPEVFKQMSQESNRFLSLDVFIGVEADVEPKPSSLRGDADSRNSRDFSPVASRSQDGSFALRRPCLDDSRDKQESALVKEDQMGSKPIGLFLYAARRDVSSNESRLPASPWLSWSASGSSSPSPASDTRDWSWSNGYESASGLRRLSAGASRPGLNNRPPEGLWRESESISVSLLGLTVEDVLACVSTAAHPSLVFGRLDSSARPNLKKRASGRQRHERSSPSGEAELRNAFVFPVLPVCHGVSYPIVYHELDIVSIINWSLSSIQPEKSVKKPFFKLVSSREVNKDSAKCKIIAP